VVGYKPDPATNGYDLLETFIEAIDVDNYRDFVISGGYVHHTSQIANNPMPFESTEYCGANPCTS